MLPIGPLMEEHRIIERIIPYLRSAVEAGRRDGTVDPRLLELVLDFIPTYADRCHHGKEEGLLFAALDKKPLAPEHRTVMDELVEEHRQGRRAVQRIRGAAEAFRRGDPEALATVFDAFEFLAVFYPAHILKEDRRFFVPVMEYFSAEERRALLEAGYDFDRRLFHELYREKVSG